MKELLQTMEEIAYRNQIGVALNLEKVPVQVTPPQQQNLAPLSSPVLAQGATSLQPNSDVTSKSLSQTLTSPMQSPPQPSLILTTPPLSVLQQQQESHVDDTTPIRVLMLVKDGSITWPIPEVRCLGVEDKIVVLVTSWLTKDLVAVMANLGLLTPSKLI